MKQPTKKKPALAKKRKRTPPTRPADTPWQTGSICQTIPDCSQAFWKGGVLQENQFSSAASKLIVIGAPYMDDDTGSSNACLKQCPECGTYYAWEFSRKYAAVGSEEKILLTRLSKANGEKRARAIFSAIEAYRAQFMEEAPSHIEALLHAGNAGIKDAAVFLARHQQKGCDVTFALPALAQALARIDSTSDAAMTIGGLVHSFGSQGRQNLEIILNLLQAEGMDTNDPKINAVLAACEQELRSKEKTPSKNEPAPQPIGASHPAIPRGWFLESVSYHSKFECEGQEEKPASLPCGVCAGRVTQQVYEYFLESQWCRSEQPLKCTVQPVGFTRSI